VIRLSWLQFRTQAVAALGALAVIAIALAVTGPQMTHLYDTSGIATCGASGDCGSLATAFLNRVPADQILYFLGIAVLLAAPPGIGMFWGAPLVTRELETGTFRLAWTQGVTRTRWLAVKLAVTGLAAMVTAGLLSLMLTWWSGPLDTAAGLKSGNSISFIRIGPVLFGARGITPVGYAAFAVALGVTAGVLIRRTVPAMAATLAVFAAVAIAWPLRIRQDLIAPAHLLVALTPAGTSPNLAAGPGNSITVMPAALSVKPGSWVLSTHTLDSAGHAFNAATIRACQGSDPSQALACQAALGRRHLRDLISYQPASSFWPLQWYETAIFLGLAVVLAGVCFWRIRRQAS
jgi:hypothetical protein